MRELYYHNHALSALFNVRQASCGSTVANALRGVPGVCHAECSFPDSEARVWASGTPGTPTEQLERACVDAVGSMGFGAVPKLDKADGNNGHVTLGSADDPLSSSSSSSSAPAVGAGRVSAAPSEAVLAARAAKARKTEAEAQARRETEDALKRLESSQNSGGGSGSSGGGSGGGSSGGNASVHKLKVSGMSCAVCCGKVERELRALPGASLVTVNPATHVASVAFLHSKAQPLPVLIAAVEKLGYGAEPLLGSSSSAEDAAAAEKRLNSTEEVDEWRRLLVLALSFTVPLFLLQWFFQDLTAGRVLGGVSVRGMLMLFVATPMQLHVGKRYYRAAWLGWQHGALGMDFLVSLGVGGSYLNSVVVLGVQALNPNFNKPVMFETAGMLLTFVTLGKYLETSARTYTTAALKQLASMQPRKAVRVVCSPESGLPLLTAAAEESIEASALRLGDVVKVRDCFHCLLGACSCFFVPFCVCVCLYS